MEQKMVKKIGSITTAVWRVLLQDKTLLALYLVLAIGAALQLYFLGSETMISMPAVIKNDMLYQVEVLQQFMGKSYTHYNNFKIFKASFGHLIHGQNLYAIYPNEQWDFYKYSPTFALVMGTVHYLPDVIGLTAWNVLNALALFWAIIRLPLRLTSRQLILLAIAVELMTSLQNAQSNGLMAALMIACYLHLSKGNYAMAALWVMCSVFIKVYGIVVIALFLFYPQYWKSALWLGFWGVVLAILPLIAVPPSQLVWQYSNWLTLLSADKATSLGLSVSGVLSGWFGLAWQSGITLVGIGLVGAQLLRFKLYSSPAYQLSVLASLLIWVVIFNHKAESPTFIIAMAGVLLWYYNGNSRGKWHTTLLWLAIVFTSLSVTDLFPPFVRGQVFEPLRVKVVPCILVWGVLWWEVMIMRPSKQLWLDAV
jgi:hypothetical protein